MDGTAAITLAEVRAEWSGWDSRERIDFLRGCTWLREQDDFPEIVRFVVKNGTVDDCSSIAQSIGSALPSDEAFYQLERLVVAASAGRRANFLQAIALMRHPRSVEVIVTQLEQLRSNPGLLEDDSFINFIAYDATCAVDDLLHLGVDPATFEPIVRQLAAHPCAQNVDAARLRLAHAYPELFTP